MAEPLRADDLVLCSGTLRRSPFEITARAAAAAGFRAISVYHHEYMAARAAGWTDASMRTLLDDLGLGVAEFDGRMRWLTGDDDGASAAEFVDAAATIGARSVTVLELTGRQMGVELDRDRVTESFAQLCDLAAGAGLLAHIEYFPFSGLVDFATSLDVVGAATRANGGIMVDTWHHVRGPDGGRVDLGAEASLVTAIQLGDVAEEPSPELRHEMMHGRLLPGLGAGSIAHILAALRRGGCTAPVGVEVFNDGLDARDPFEAARLAFAAGAACIAAAEEVNATHAKR